MKRYSTALLLGLLSLTSQLAHADIVDDAIGNIQKAINDAYNPSSSSSDRSSDDDDRYDTRRSTDSRQYDDRRRQLETGVAVWMNVSASLMTTGVAGR
jgi:hypothetical protein